MSTNDPPQPPPASLNTTLDPVSTATTAAASPQEPHPPSQTLPSASISDSVTAPTGASPTASLPATTAGEGMAPSEPQPVAHGETVSAPEAPEPKSDALAPQPSGQSSESSAKEEEDPGPSLVITLLLITGSRHPFKIDGKYLRKRSVKVDNDDPFAMSVYTLKELIWREWRQDWEPRPASPSSIRLISFGKLLDDKAPLSDSKFSRDAPNVVHMTVKPQELIDEEDAKASKAQFTRERDSSERSPGCRCIIQ
ncbi:ubiquitin-related domain-containing protein [Aspergillus ambiguus]|uniref:uncharacterized protein n=1 Tax=Aspergillus ambiguus TaxID=176160 RepID=UPI003CCD860B